MLASKTPWLIALLWIGCGGAEAAHHTDDSQEEAATGGEETSEAMFERFCSRDDGFFEVYDDSFWETVLDLAAEADNAAEFAAGMRNMALDAGVSDCPRSTDWETQERPPFSGSLARGAIVAGVDARRESIQQCYEAATTPAAGDGAIVIRLVIGPDGSVVAALTAGAGAESATAACLAEALQLASFESPGGLLLVNQPFPPP